ncbi:MAG: glycosyltransferase [Deltaproteobacteria bacterium]|nr:glycosyltransferase [Deltaproteobacteria bacterium]
MDFSMLLSLFIFLSLSTLTFLFVKGLKQVGYLRQVLPSEALLKNPPRLSLIIAARNEEKKIEAAIKSLINQDYPNYHLLVINDRSTDNTGKILSRLAKDHGEKLQVHNLQKLPVGWLGKNHALQYGLKHSQGDLVLLMDADILAEPSTLSRAVTYLEKQQLDHLPILPTFGMQDFWLQAVAGFFVLFLNFLLRPWKAKDPKSKAYMGVGAFNLIRRQALEKIGGLQSIRLRPDEDLRLGQKLKESGARQEVLWGKGLLQVEWYHSLKEMMDGLVKNTYAGMGFRFYLLLILSLVVLTWDVWPFTALMVSQGLAWYFNLASCFLLFLLYQQNASTQGLPSYHALVFPISALIFLYMIWRAILITLKQGGVHWRETFYSLEELKKTETPNL